MMEKSKGQTQALVTNSSIVDFAILAVSTL